MRVSENLPEHEQQLQHINRGRLFLRHTHMHTMTHTQTICPTTGNGGYTKEKAGEGRMLVPFLSNLLASFCLYDSHVRRENHMWCCAVIPTITCPKVSRDKSRVPRLGEPGEYRETMRKTERQGGQ